jgi:hypothetical protein
VSFDTLSSVAQLFRWIMKLWTISIFFFSFFCLNFFLSLCHHLTFEWTVAITGVHQIEYFSLHSCPLDFLNLCSSSSCVRTCSRQWWLLSAPESYMWRNMWVTSILKQLHILIIPYVLFWTWDELYFQNLYLNLQYLSNRFHIVPVTCSVTDAWGITTLLRLQCCVACSTFSSFNCGKNMY